MTAPMTVTRVPTGHGSHIEPPLNHAWSELDRLRWCAAVATCDTGVTVTVEQSQQCVFKSGLWRRVTRRAGWQPITGRYDARWSGSVAMIGDYSSAWSWLTGFRAGAEARGRQETA